MKLPLIITGIVLALIVLPILGAWFLGAIAGDSDEDLGYK